MHRRLHNLNRSIIPHIHRRIRREGNLRQTKRSRIRSLAWPSDLEHWHHGERHVWGTAERGIIFRTIVAESEVDVEEGGGVALEPAGLDGDGAAGYRPVGAVAGGGHTAAWRVMSAEWFERIL